MVKGHSGCPINTLRIKYSPGYEKDTPGYCYILGYLHYEKNVKEFFTVLKKFFLYIGNAIKSMIYVY